MYIFIRQILSEMWLHKLRSSLAIFCIAFGTFTVIMLSALSEGFYEESERSMINDVADGSFFVWQRQSTKTYQGFSKGQNVFSVKDIIDLPKVFPNIEAVSPEPFGSGTLSYVGKTYTKSVIGVAPDYSKLRKIKVEKGGRFINQIDIKNRSRVVVIGLALKNLFFGQGEAVGSKLLINGIPFTVIGVEKGKNSYNRSTAFISYQSYSSLYGENDFYQFLALPSINTDPKQLEESLRSYFAQKYHFDKTDKSALGFFSSSEIFQFIHWFLIGIQMFLSACGAMTLAIGGVGVGNLMFLTVTERTREIGLRKAVGATDRQILLQMLLEALVVVGVGGALGFGFGFFTITFLQHISLPGWIGVPKLSWMVSSFTVLVLALTGLMAGFFPARRAAKMDPVKALAV